MNAEILEPLTIDPKKIMVDRWRCVTAGKVLSPIIMGEFRRVLNFED